MQCILSCACELWQGTIPVAHANASKAKSLGRGWLQLRAPGVQELDEHQVQHLQAPRHSLMLPLRPYMQYHRDCTEQDQAMGPIWGDRYHGGRMDWRTPKMMDTAPVTIAVPCPFSSLGMPAAVPAR